MDLGCGLAAPRRERLTDPCLVALLVGAFWVAAAQALRFGVLHNEGYWYLPYYCSLWHFCRQHLCLDRAVSWLLVRCPSPDRTPCSRGRTRVLPRSGVLWHSCGQSLWCIGP
jgi:hypothetical protein